MKYTKQDFGAALKTNLDNGYTPAQIGKWAHSFFFQNCRELDPDFKDIVEKLLLMEEALEFEYSKEDLFDIAEKLISGSNLKL